MELYYGAEGVIFIIDNGTAKFNNFIIVGCYYFFFARVECGYIKKSPRNNIWLNTYNMQELSLSFEILLKWWYEEGVDEKLF